MQYPARPDLLHYYHVIKKEKYRIGTVTVATAVVTAIFSLFQPNIFTAKTMILPLQQQTGVPLPSSLQGALGNVPGDPFSDKTPARLYAELLKLESVRDPIIDKFNLF